MKRIQVTCVFVLLCSIFSQAQNQVILENKDKVIITRVDNLNSSYQETNLSLSPDGKYLLFRSDRGGMPWSRYGRTYKSNCRADGDIYISEKIDGVWGKAVCLPKSINTGEAQDEPSITSDGKIIIYQSWANGWEHEGGPYYAAKFNGMNWSEPIGLGGGINAFFVKQMDKYKKTATDGMSVSPDGKTLIFAWGLDYSGNLDLYISKKKNAEWSYPEKLPFNTVKDERSVFIANDGKTLYFASDGYNGFGGLDIYKTVLNEDGTFGEIVNIGEPFNTKQDDYGFIITPAGDEAYFVRDGDIYHAGLAGAERAIPPLPVDSVAVPAAIHDVKVVYKPAFRDYTFVVNYDYNQNKIMDKYFESLNKIIDTLKNNPSLKLEIYGHTDSNGSDEFNLELGATRANKLKDYFTAHGISPEKLFTLSMGEYSPLYPEKSASDTEHAAKNRRCEIWIKK